MAMAIRDSFKLRSRWCPSSTDSQISDALVRLAERYGWGVTGTWLVVRTRFHGGGIISRHKTAYCAVMAAIKHRGQTDCTCGCCGVVPYGIRLPGVEANDKNGYSPNDLCA